MSDTVIMSGTIQITDEWCNEWFCTGTVIMSGTVWTTDEGYFTDY